MTSLIVPVFNREKLLRETIESVIGQTYIDWELILVDDGSTDESYDIALTYQIKDERIKVHRRNKMPKGAPTCRNMGIDLSIGEYIIFLDSDDLLDRTCLEKRVTFMNRNDHLDYSVWNVQTFDDSNAKELWSDLSSKDDLKSFLRSNGWQTSSPIYRANVFKDINWTLEMPLWQDWDFHINLLLDNTKSYEKLTESIPDIFIRRTHKDRISSHVYHPSNVIFLCGLFLKTERKLELNDKSDYKRYLFELWFHYMEYAAINFKKIYFRKTLKIWKESALNNAHKSSRVIKSYFLIQNFLRINGTHVLQAVPYRIMKRLQKVFVANA